MLNSRPAQPLSPHRKRVRYSTVQTRRKPQAYGIVFNWGLSSKAPKPPLERLRAGCKPHGQPSTHAYIQPENVGLSGGEEQLFINQQDVRLSDNRILPHCSEVAGEPEKTFATTGRKGKFATAGRGSFCGTKTQTHTLAE